MMMGGNPMMMGGNLMIMEVKLMIMGVNPMMMGMGIGINQQQMTNGYQMEDKQSTTNFPTNSNTINSQSSTNSKITVNFQKDGVTTKVEMETTSAIFELINEFCEKTNTNSGTFKFGNQALSHCDCRNLSEAGLKNGDIIIVS